MSAVKTLNVDLAGRSYPIHIGDGLLDEPGLIAPHLGSGRVMVVTDSVVAPLYLDRLLAQFDNPGHVVLPAGEAHKKLASLNPVFDALVAEGCGRDAVLVVLGGGVIGDMGGFAAACYHRGIDFVQVPTTLLAQVDSSVGGKTGVNHDDGKNLIGAFHQPRCVVIDIGTLASLDARNLRAGLAEVIKYGLIADEPFLSWLERNIDALLKCDSDALTHAIHHSCATKARIVEEDETERRDRRALLNLGHTFGHAIEHVTGFSQWLHGEAVAAGMVMAADFSLRLGWLTTADCDRTRRLLERAGLPTAPPPCDPAHFLSVMGRDKKVIGGRIRLVLLKALGDACVVDDYPDDALGDLLEAALR